MEQKKKKLQELRDKWTGKVPSPLDYNYLEFRVDRNHAFKLKKEIEFNEKVVKDYENLKLFS